MITSVHFENCGPLRDATLPLEPFTLIIGPNGSGKTTALRCLGDNQFASPMSFAPVRFDDPPSPRAELRWSSGRESFITRIVMPGDRHLHHMSLGSEQPVTGREHDVLDQRVRRARYYTLQPEQLAMPSHVGEAQELARDGSNLAAMLDWLNSLEHELFEQLNRAVAAVMPEFDRILLDSPTTGSKVVLMRTASGGYRVPATALAQGTLIALALLTLAWLPQPPTLVCLEEPDRGLHPRLLRDVKSALRRLAFPAEYDEQREPVQVIASTHNPFFLDLFRDELEQVVIASKHGLEATFRRAADIPNIDLILRDSMLSNAWYTGVLGGVPEPACALPS